MRTRFDPEPVIATTLDLLAHPERLNIEALSGCGTCTCTGRVTLPGGRVRVVCHMCRGTGVR